MKLSDAEKLYTKETGYDIGKDPWCYYDDDFVTWLASKIPNENEDQVGFTEGKYKTTVKIGARTEKPKLIPPPIPRHKVKGEKP
jgi:hypothetical protein